MWEVAFVAMAVIGWIGSIVPALPGLTLSLAALVGYGYVTGFTKVSGYTVVVAAALTIANYVAGYYLGAGLARRFGQVEVPALAIFLGSVLGLSFLGPLGFLIGPVIVVLGKALLSGLGPGRGLRSAVAVVVSMGLGVLLEFFLSSWVLFVLIRAVLL